jgi:rhodanese-related sulfurtransferase
LKNAMHALEIDLHEAKALLDSAAPPRLIDCREADEWAICRLPHAALLPLSIWGEQFREKLADPEEPILIYCHHGMRSLRAASFLAQLGYADVRSIRGGIDAWSREIDPDVPRY